MKLTSNQQAPDFAVRDVYGSEINLRKLQGKKVYLAFERNAGCPVCNLRTHELLKAGESFRSRNIEVVLVFESSVEKMKDHLGDETYPFHFVADPQNKLYDTYGVERSMFKILKGLFNGLITKAGQGTKLFKKPTKQDGHTDRIPAEFVIDEHGKLIKVHYGRFLGDHLDLAYLKNV